MSRTTGQPELEELRIEIDTLDEQIVALLAARTAVVSRIGRLKRDLGHEEDAVRSLDRVERVVERVRGLAESHGMDPVIADRTYRCLIAALTDMQLSLVRQER